MTARQTVEIPDNHRIFLDLPRDLPVGKTRVELTFTPLAENPGMGKKVHLTKPIIEELLQGEALRSLTGFLRTEMSVDEIRAERLKKHDHTN